MTQVFINKEISDRLSGHQGLKKALKEFVAAIQEGRHPKRIYKPSGIDKRGERFDPYIRLKLWHHHLGRTGEPLLVLQVSDDRIDGIALTSHAAHFHGDKMLWLKQHMAGIDWTHCEDLKAAVQSYHPAGC